MRIYTLGTANRTKEEFLKILDKYQIKIVFDVRRFPTSHFEHFKRENLIKLCEENKITYTYLGNELGGFRKSGYLKWTETQSFKKGIEIIYKQAVYLPAVILCREKYPFYCHRRYIADNLNKMSVEVIHIISEEKTINHKELNYERPHKRNK
jgi:uncharacterized protein (DUF488 family)